MTELKFRDLLPKLAKPGDRPWMMRLGLASILQASVEISSLGKMTTDWALDSTFMSRDKNEIRRFLEHVSRTKPHMTWRRRPLDRADLMAGSVVRLAEGALELISCGRVTASWMMLWVCYGDDAVDWCADKLGQDR